MASQLTGSTVGILSVWITPTTLDFDGRVDVQIDCFDLNLNSVFLLEGNGIVGSKRCSVKGTVTSGTLLVWTRR